MKIIDCRSFLKTIEMGATLLALPTGLLTALHARMAVDRALTED